MPDGIEGKLAQLEELLEETAALAKENNDLLRRMRRMDRISLWTKLILWALVLGLPLLFIGPILHTILPVTTGTPTNVFGIPSPAELQNALHEIQTRSGGGQ